MLDCVRELGVAMAKARNAAVSSMGATEDEIRSLVLEVEELDTEVATLRHWMQGSVGKVVNGDGVEVDNEYARQQALAIELATVEDRVNVNTIRSSKIQSVLKDFANTLDAYREPSSNKGQTKRVVATSSARSGIVGGGTVVQGGGTDVSSLVSSMSPAPSASASASLSSLSSFGGTNGTNRDATETDSETKRSASNQKGGVGGLSSSSSSSSGDGGLGGLGGNSGFPSGSSGRGQDVNGDGDGVGVKLTLAPGKKTKRRGTTKAYGRVCVCVYVCVRSVRCAVWCELWRVLCVLLTHVLIQFLSFILSSTISFFPRYEA